MPSTVEQVCSDALMSIGSDAGLTVASRFLALRYRKLASKVRFRHLRRRAALTMPKQLSTGTVTFTLDSDLVTLSAEALTALTAIGPALAGRFIRPGSGATQPWLEVAGLEVGGLRLATPFPSTTLAASGYVLVARYHRLAADVRWLGRPSVPRLNCQLVLSSGTEADYYSAGRNVVGSGYPHYFWLAPPDFDGRAQIEIYPPAGLADEVVNYPYHAEPPRSLQPTDMLPMGLSEDCLREGIMIDLLLLEWTKAVKSKDYDAAAHYRNEYNTQRTRWERDAYGEAGDVDTTLPDDFIMVRGSERSTDDMLQRGLEIGQWPEGL